MSKCRVVIAGIPLVMDTEVAMKVFNLLNDVQAEKIDYDYISREGSPTGQSQHLYYLKPMSDDLRLEGLIAEDYAMWKLYTSTREEKK
jgi:hypothetical protein